MLSYIENMATVYKNSTMDNVFSNYALLGVNDSLSALTTLSMDSSLPCSIANDRQSIKINDEETVINYVDRKLEWIFGFCGDNITFDLYQDGEFLQHFDLRNYKFAKLMNKHNKTYMYCALNNSFEREYLEIRNVISTGEEPHIYIWGAVLNGEERRETSRSGIKVFTL